MPHRARALETRASMVFTIPSKKLITVHELTSRVRHQSSQLGKMSKQHADDKDGFLKRIHQLETELKRLKGQLDEARARNVLLQAQVLAGSGQQGYELLRIDEAWSPALDENANEMDAQTKTAITPMAGFSRRLSVARTRTIEAVAQLTPQAPPHAELPAPQGTAVAAALV